MSSMRRALKLMSLSGMSIVLSQIPPKVYQSEPRQRVVSNAERKAILAECGLDLRIYLTFCADLGLRTGTAVRVAACHWDRQTNEIRINGLKHGGSIVTPLTNELQRLLEECERQSPDASETEPYVTRARSKAQRAQSGKATPGSIRYALNRRLGKITKRLGIVNMRPHDLRRTLAERVYEATSDLRIVQAVLGHRTLRTTGAYIQRSTIKPTKELLERIKQP